MAIVAVLGVLLWTVGDSDAPSTGAGPAVGAPSDSARSAHLSELVSDLGAAWEARDKQRFVAVAGSSSDAHSWAAQTYANLRKLRVEEFTAEFVAEDDDGIRPDGTFAADISVSWTPAKSSGLAATETEPVTVQMVFRPSGEGYDVERIRPADDPLPLWLAGGLRVERHRKADLVYIDSAGGPGRLKPGNLTGMSRHARRDVRDIVEGQVGPTTVVVPSTPAQAAALLGRSKLGKVAALSTTADGSTTNGAAAYVVLNPGRFAGLDKHTAQTALTRQVTHALTGAATTTMPSWVAEGFADYVALRGDSRGVRKGVSQILAKVRDSGVPKNLPNAGDFDAAPRRQRVVHQSAALIFELLHLRAPDEQLVEFYEEVRDGADVERALEDNFGLDVETLTALWREYLDGLAAHP